VTITQKLTVGYVLPLAILAAITGLSYWSTAALVETSQSVTHAHEVLTELEKLMSLMKDAETGQRGYLLVGEDKENYLEPYENARAKWEDVFANLKRLTRASDSQQQRLDEMKPLLTEKLKEMQSTIDERKNDKDGNAKKGFEEALKIVKSNRGKDLMDRARALAAKMTEEESNELKKRDAEARTNVQLTHWTIGIAAVLAFILVAVTSFLISRSITLPVRGAVNQLTSTSAEILAGTAQQATGAQEQAAAISQTVSTVSEVAQSSEQAAQRARGVGEAVQRTLEIGRKGRMVVEESIGALGVVRGQVESTAENILALAEQAQAISEIIATVNDIAEQTNLLALNAAIEASRAGEHGRGFVVVAGEIKALADQSKKATAQVRQILGEIQRATNTAVLSTEEVTRGVAAAAAVAGQSGEAIKSLADTLSEAAQAASQIVASAGQQATGMAQIQQAVLSIDQVSRQNLAATKQAEQAAQTLNVLAARFASFTGDAR
jgi:methyl-accepting chemotaxis protein